MDRNLETLKQFLREAEGWRNTVYMDVTGHGTIGCGHLLSRMEFLTGTIQIGPDLVDYSSGLTDDQVDQLLEQDLEPVIQALDRLVKVPLNPNQYAALASFVFNVGVNAFKNSTLLKKLNRGLMERIVPQLRQWIYSAGKPVLIGRREREVQLWNMPMDRGQDRLA